MTATTPARILVVDDEPRNVKLLEALLVPKGYAVVTAPDGATALRVVEEHAVDLILLDVMMPTLDGFRVTRALRANPRTRLLPIVLVTALKDTEDRIRGIEAGCDDFISKPFDQQEVLARVKTLLTLSYYRSLLDEKAKFDYVIDHMDDGIVVLDAALRMSRVNTRAATLLGLDTAAAPEDVLGYLQRTFRLAYAGDLRQDLGSQNLTCDLERPETPTMKNLALEMRSTVVRDPNGRTSSIVLLLRDVTAARKETTLKQNFLGLISHKLRTPVAVITINASVLQEGVFGPLTEQQQPPIGTILETTQKLGELIDKLLAFTILHEQASRLAWESLVLREHLPRLLEPILKRAKTKPVDLKVEGLDHASSITINRSAFDLIISHLVENAIKFNDKERVQLAIVMGQQPSVLEVSVRDNGPGIPPEEHERIFESFYQIDKDFTGNVQGVGLGLALVKRLVAASGGTVQVHSELGRGATFVFTLPTLDKPA